MDLRELAAAVLNGAGLYARQWVQDATRDGLDWSAVTEPRGASERELVVAAALADLFADRAKVSRPEWTSRVGAASESIWLVRKDLPRFARRVEREVPAALRSRQVFAPADFLSLS